MKHTRYLIVFTLTLAFVAAAAGQTENKPPVDPAGWVPGDALAYIGVSDVEQLGEQFRQTSFYKRTQDPELKESWGQVSILLKLHEEFKNRLAKSLDTQPDKLENPFGGPMALYVPMPRDKSAGEPRVVFVAGIGDAELMKSYYQRATRKFREIAGKHEAIPFGAYVIDRFTAEVHEEEQPNESEADFAEADFGTDNEDFAASLDKVLGLLFFTDAMPEELVLCLTEDRLIVAPTPEHVKAVLRREPTSDSLLGSATYQTLLREFKPPGTLRFLINLPGWFELMRAAEGDKATEALAMLGAGSMRGVVGHILFDNQEFESKIEALLLLSGERTGLAKLLSMKNRPVSPAATVSAENSFYAGLNANVTEILDELERMIRRDDPDAADQMRASIESIELPDGQTLNPRKEVLEHLRAPLTFALTFRQPYGPQSTHMLLTLGHRDKAALARFLEQLSSMFPGMLIQREVRGTLVYENLFLGFSLASTNDALIIGTTNAVDTALQTPTPVKSLAADPTFQRAAALAASEAWGVVYVDSRRVFEAAIELAKNKDASTTTQPANLIALGIVEAFTNGIEENELDTVRRLAAYQAPSIITLTTTPAGIRIVQVQLVPGKN